MDENDMLMAGVLPVDPSEGCVPTERAGPGGHGGHGGEFGPLIPLDSGRTLPAFPTGVLPGWLRDWVQGVAVGVQVPPDLPGMLAFSILATACGGRVRVRVKPGWSEPTNLYAVVVLDPGNRKTSVFEEATAPLLLFELRQAEQLRESIHQSEEERAVLRGALKRERGRGARASSPAKRQESIRKSTDLREKLAALPIVAPPCLFVDDVTAEKLASLLAEHSGRMAVLSAEGGIFDTMAGRYSNAPSFEVYLKGHAGDCLRVSRQTRPGEHVDSPALTLGLTVQREVLRGLANQPGFRGKGLLARFLLSIPVSLVGRRAVDPPPLAQRIREEYSGRIMDLLRRKLPEEIPLSPQALETMFDFQRALEPKLGDGGELSHLADWGAKLAGAVARIAGLLQLAEDWNSDRVEKETLERAILVGEYLLQHAKAAFGLMGADPAIEDAKRVLRWIQRKQLTEFTQREAYQALKGAGRFQKVSIVESALDLLVLHGYLAWAEGSRGGRGQPSPVLRTNPLALDCAPGYLPHAPHTPQADLHGGHGGHGGGLRRPKSA